MKLPAEAFVGIKETCDNGLKVAITYPNPTHDELHLQYSPDVHPTQQKSPDCSGLFSLVNEVGITS